MARQKSFIKLEGELGGILFYQTKDGFVARQKTGVSGDKIKSDPRFARTRENNAEFKRGAQGAKLIRSAFRDIAAGIADKRITSRLIREAVKIVKSDPVSLRGERNMLEGDQELLTGFEFNVDGTLASTFYVIFEASLDRVTGQATIDIPAFNPQKMMLIPEGTTHFRFLAAASTVDFENSRFRSARVASAELAVNRDVAALQLNAAFTPDANEQTVFVAFGIEFLQLVNGQHYPLINGNFNAMAFVLIDKPQA
ncbi:hypothetical protein [Dawidia soli]|uniref:Uncharacterized protein n=1 Tax=Dawidia soli TaxID=2782352 RepID=A0AAP2DAN2_9BACT|nr:hypothetical protein [Dawidia soli]MBT1688037.1 hypothetical protein [Dawidia soli]